VGKVKEVMKMFIFATFIESREERKNENWGTDEGKHPKLYCK
jgi:hypothetical protein